MSPKTKTVCFLVGAPRSGTTWIQRLLQSHPLICGGEESHFFTMFGQPLTSAVKWTEPGRKRKIGPLTYVTRSQFEDIIRNVWSQMFRDHYDLKPESVIHLEKTPGHAFYLDQIQRLFPDCKIIFLTRDSRAVTSSLVHAGGDWGHYWAPNTYKGAAIMWYRHNRAILNWHHRNPDHPFLQIGYEEIVRDTPAELLRILHFLFQEKDNLQLDTTLRAFEVGEAARKDPEGFSRQRGIHGWLEDMPPLGKLITWHYTRKLMRELGYEITPFR